MNSHASILVTGGAGFIGSHLVERLLNDGEHVVVIDDFSTGNISNLEGFVSNTRFRLLRSKVSQCSELESIVAQSKAVYHLAAAVGVDLVTKSPLHTLQTNLHETEVLLKAAAEHLVPVLLTSSSEVYGKSEKDEFSEEDDLLIGPPTCARWGYACSKLTDEFLAFAYAKEKKLPIVIARLFNTVGPRQTGRYGMVLPRFVEAAKAGEPLRVHGDGSQTRCFCHVADVIESLTRLMNNSAARGQIFNIGSTEEVSIRDLAKLVISVLGSKSGIEFIPYSAAYPPGFDDMRRRKPNVQKLHQTLQYRPTKTLADIIQSIASNAHFSPIAT